MSPWELTLSEASALIARRELSPVELTTALLERISDADVGVGAFAEVYAEDAVREAERIERQLAASGPATPLHGIPISAKDVYDVAGKATRAGSALRESHIASSDSAAITLLRRAGAIIIGKAQTHEFAFGVTTPSTRNPWNTARSPGGSSGGSAASVASRMVMASLASDTAGSIRIPSSLCGVVGLKPTYGLIPTTGATPLSWSLDHAGPIARTVRDVAMVVDQMVTDRRTVTAGPGDGPETLAGSLDLAGDDLRGVTVGVPDNHYFDRCHPDIERCVREAIEVLGRLGAELRPVTVPLAPETLATATVLIGSEAASYHQRDLAVRAHLYTAETREKLLNGALILAKDYVSALRARQLIARKWRELMAEVDLVAAPVTAAPAVPVGATSVVHPDGTQEAVTPAYCRLNIPANVTGLPALSQPCGFGASGLPVGLQLIGRPYQEAALLRVGHVYEAAAWPRHGPDLSALPTDPAPSTVPPGRTLR